MIDNCPVGTIVMWPGSEDAVPKDWMVCDGSKLPVPVQGQTSATTELYAVIGHSFDPPPGSPNYDPNSFLLPNLRV
ncbi:MAG: tail fiber protein, partial [Mesorhizobium sp.]